MTRMRCWAFTPDNRFAFSVTAPWFSHKRPINWGMPANENFGFLDPADISLADWFGNVDFTPTGDKRP